MAYLCCFCRNVMDGFASFSGDERVEVNHPVVLDTNHIGHEVVIVKNGTRICGGGGALASAPLVQNKSYFEAKVQQSGIWSVGVATELSQLSSAPGGSDKESWVLCSDGVVRHDGQDIHKLADIPQEGDTIGVSYDHIELNFYCNGKNLNIPMSGIRGTVYAVLFVDEGAIMDFVSEHFSYPPPPGFERILLEQSLL
ncbi:SPRY domain-containing protein 7 [Neocloeon triangulifer]|uniref:SPRY domain-containing protein 7 n=1 Tax=Neocloeon triangulifer TaxID=2078957 RepID=UPI00286F36EA|nr:SPRY domain-containing protein 7 [Neocloeon triangulifer]